MIVLPTMACSDMPSAASAYRCAGGGLIIGNAAITGHLDRAAGCRRADLLFGETTFTADRVTIERAS
jgi:hypothetical protein